MIGGEVIIGFPSEPLGASNPGKYLLNGRGKSAIVKLLPESSQTLINSTIIQAESTTILTFHKHLVEPGELPVNGNGQTTFIWAYSEGNDLTGHADRGAFNLTLFPCDGNPTSRNQDIGNVVKVETSGTYRSLWTAHGVFAGVAWGIVVPLAIASTLLRDLFPNPKLAVKIHILLNLVASLAVYNGRLYPCRCRSAKEHCGRRKPESFLNCSPSDNLVSHHDFHYNPSASRPLSSKQVSPSANAGRGRHVA